MYTFQVKNPVLRLLAIYNPSPNLGTPHRRTITSRQTCRPGGSSEPRLFLQRFRSRAHSQGSNRSNTRSMFERTRLVWGRVVYRVTVLANGHLTVYTSLLGDVLKGTEAGTIVWCESRKKIFSDRHFSLCEAVRARQTAASRQGYTETGKKKTRRILSAAHS